MRKSTIKIFLLSIFTASTVLYSCSENQMDEVNKNENNPTLVQARFVLTDVLTRTAFNNVGSDFNTYLSSYVEHEIGSSNQLWDAEHRVSQPQLSSTFNNTWNSIYVTLRNAQVIITKCSPGGSEEGNYKTLGIAQVMAAYNLALLTDMFGDVPYFDAINPYGNKTPKLDKQEALYTQVFLFLDEALVNLSKGDVVDAGAQDFLFGGSAPKWIRFANGLKARYTMRLIDRAANRTEALNKVIDYVNLSFANSADEAAFNIYNAQNRNPLFNFQWSRAGLAASRSLVDKLIDRADPRLSRNFVNKARVQVSDLGTNSTNYNLLAVNGENLDIQGPAITSMFVYSQTASTQLLSYHELIFLKAEAMQRLGAASSDVIPVLKLGIVSGIKNSEKSVIASFSAPAYQSNGGVTETSSAITDVMIDNYFTNSVLPLFNANPMKEIAVQKYLSFSGASGESTEVYNDIRRWKANGEEFITLKNPGKFPVRLPYGSSEITTNPNVEAAFGDGSYVYSEKVWWAGGTR